MHSVNPDTMRLPDDASSQHPLRPMLGGRNSSNVSLLSTSSSSSVFSFGSSVSNSSSLAPRSRAPSLVPSNPPSRQHTGVRAGLSEVKAAVKRRTSKASLKFTHRQPTKSRDVLSVWANISSWLKEGSRVLRLVDRCPQRSSALPSNGTPPHPLSSPEALAAYRAEFDLAKFGEEVGRYRAYTSAKEKEHGRGKRIFAHNDAQYGNILIRVTSVNNPLDDLQRAMDDVGIEKPHELLIVVCVALTSVVERSLADAAQRL